MSSLFLHHKVIAGTEIRTTSLISEIERLLTLISQQEDRIHELKGTVDQYKEENTALKATIQSLNEEIKILTKENSLFMESIKELRAYKTLMHEVSQSLMDMITCVTPSGTVTYNSPIVSKYIGFRPEELNGRSLFEMIRKDFQEYARQEFEKGIKNKQAGTIVLPFLHKNGNDIWIEASYNAIFNKDGDISKVIFASRDITERLMMQEKLTKQQNLQNLITENMRDMLSVLSADLTFSYTSASYFKTLGYLPQDLVGTKVLDLIHPDDLPRANALVARVLNNELSGAPIELRCRHANGEYLWVESVANVLYTGPRAIDHIILSSRECTERKHMQAEIEKIHTRMREIIEKNVTGYYETDTHGYFFDANQALADILRMPLSQIKAKPITRNDLVSIFGEQDHIWKAFVTLSPEGTLLFKKNAIVMVKRSMPDSEKRATLLSLIKRSLGVHYKDIVTDTNIKDIEEAFRLVREFRLPMEKFEFSITSAPAHCDTSVTPVIEDDMLTGYSGFIKDVTEERTIREQERKTREQFENIVNLARDFIYNLDNKGLVTFVNHAVTEQSRGMIGKHFLDFVAPEHQEEVNAFYQKQIQKRTPSTYYEFPLQVRKDKVIWLGQNLQLLFDKQGSISGFQAICHDITKRVLAEQKQKQAEEELGQFQELLIETINKVSEGVFIHDHDTIILVNAAFAALVGKEQEDIIHTNGLAYIDAKDRPSIVSYMNGKERTIPKEINLKNKQGTRIPVEPQSIRLSKKGATGKRLRLWTFLDLTERKAHVEQIKQMAMRDDLTGLPQRNLFAENFNKAVANAERARAEGLPYPVSFLFCDINNFKEYNEKLSHTVGDSMIKQAGEVLSSSIRNTDFIARDGGDEFTILLENIEGGTDAVVNKIMKAAVAHKLRFSIGIYHVDLASKDLSRPDNLLKRYRDYADQAAHKAKTESEQRPVTVTIDGKTLDLKDNRACYYDFSYTAKGTAPSATVRKLRQTAGLTGQYFKTLWHIFRS